MKKTIPTTINMTLGTLFIGINIFCWFVIPILAINNWLWLMCWIPALLLSNTMWALIHEAIHCIFHPNKSVNLKWGRMLSLSFGIEFHIARFGHLLHHRFNRSGIDLTDGYDPEKIPKWLANLGYYLQICIGLYLSEILVPILLLFPKQVLLFLGRKTVGEQAPHYQVAKSALLKNPTLYEIRIGTIAMLIIWIISFYLYGHFWWVLLVAALIRGFMVSFADNLPHYGTATNDVRYAYNLSLPPFLQKGILNFNLHRVHHHYPNIPWKQLPEKFMAINDQLDVNYFKQGMKQWRGVIPTVTLNRIKK